MPTRLSPHTSFHLSKYPRLRRTRARGIVAADGASSGEPSASLAEGWRHRWADDGKGGGIAGPMTAALEGRRHRVAADSAWWSVDGSCRYCDGGDRRGLSATLHDTEPSQQAVQQRSDNSDH